MDYIGQTGKIGPAKPKISFFQILGKVARRRLPYLALALLALFLLGFGLRYWWREMRWRYIILHHTAADIGNMEFYRRLHEQRWGDLAYHIVVNNGANNTVIGEIEMSQRWINRQHHYSTQKTYLNYFGIAVVLVGNFELHDVPAVQKEALINLLSNLAKEYDIPPQRIIGHREVQNTRCPGLHVNMVEVRHMVSQNLK